jgi:hypothetical protein
MKFIHVLACAVGTIALATRADAQVLYASTASGGPGELYILNPANGAVIRDIGPLTDAGGTNYGITGLAFHPTTGVLYGSTANDNTATRAQLVTINPVSGRVTVIGPYNAGNAGTRPATMADLAFTSSGQLFGVGSVGGPNLYSINIGTGQATLVGASGLTSTGGGGLAISPTGVYFGTPTASPNARFGTYNPTTGVFTNITAPTLPGGGSYAALAFNGNTLYGLNSGSGTPAPIHLVTFNTTTGAVTDLGLSPIVNLDGMAFGPAAVPEPGPMALLLGPLAVGLATAVRRRKHSATRAPVLATENG